MKRYESIIERVIDALDGTELLEQCQHDAAQIINVAITGETPFGAPIDIPDEIQDDWNKLSRLVERPIETVYDGLVEDSEGEARLIELGIDPDDVPDCGESHLEYQNGRILRATTDGVMGDGSGNVFVSEFVEAQS